MPSWGRNPGSRGPPLNTKVWNQSRKEQAPGLPTKHNPLPTACSTVWTEERYNPLRYSCALNCWEALQNVPKLGQNGYQNTMTSEPLIRHGLGQPSPFCTPSWSLRYHMEPSQHVYRSAPCSKSWGGVGGQPSEAGPKSKAKVKWPPMDTSLGTRRYTRCTVPREPPRSPDDVHRMARKRSKRTPNADTSHHGGSAGGASGTTHPPWLKPHGPPRDQPNAISAHLQPQPQA